MPGQEQKYESFANLSSLEKEKARIITMFDDIEKGILKLKDLGIDINTAKTVKGVKGLSDEFDKQNQKIKEQQNQLVKMAEKLAALTSQEAKQAEALKQVTNLTKQLTAEEIKHQFIRQAEYANLQQAKIANQELSKSIQLRIKLRNAEEGSEEQLSLQHKKAIGILKKLSEAQRQSTRGQALEQFANDVNQKLKAIEQRIGNFRRNVGNYANSLADGFKIVRDEISKLQTKQQGLQDLGKRDPIGFKFGGQDKEVEALGFQIGKLQSILEIGENTNQSYDKTVKQIGKSYKDMAASGQFTEEFLKEFKQFAGEAKDSAADLNDELKAAASDTRKFDLISGAISTMVSSFQVAVGVSELFGENNEDIQRSIQKLIAVQNIANGVREIAAQVTNKTTVAGKAYNFVVGQTAIITAKASTATQRFSAILKLTGIGFLITLLGALISKMDIFGGSAKDAVSEMDLFNQRLERSNELLDEANRKIDTTTKLRLLRAKELGKGESQLNAITIAGLAARAINEQKAASSQIASVKQRLATYGIEVNTAKQASEALVFLRKRNAEKEIAAVSSALNHYQNAEQARTEITLANSELRVGKADKQREAQKKATDEFVDQSEREKKAALELNAFLLNLEKEKQDAVAEGETFGGANSRVKAAEESARIQKQILDDQFNYEKSRKGLTISELALLELKYNTDKEKITEDTERRITKIIVDENQKRIAAAQEGSDDFDKDMEERFNKQLEASNKALEKDLNNADINAAVLQRQNVENFEAGLKTKEQFDKRKEEIENQHQATLLQIQVNAAKAQMALLEAQGMDTTELAKTIAEAEEKIAELRIGKTQKTVKEEKAMLEEIKANYLETFQSIAESIGNVLGGISERRKLQIQEEMDEIDKRKSRELDAINASGDSEEKKAARIKIIEANAVRDKEALERRKRQIDRQRAIFDRSLKAFEIVTDTIVTVNKIKGQLAAAGLNPVARGLLISQLVLAIASGAASLTSLVATPLPGYKRGTESSIGGYAHVAEEGPELGVDPSGKLKYWEKPTIAKLVKGTKILPAQTTANIISAANHDVVHPAIAFIEKRDRTDDVIYHLKRIEERSGIRITNQFGIETTAWYLHNMKN